MSKIKSFVLCTSISIRINIWKCVLGLPVAVCALNALADMPITSSSGCATITDVQSVNNRPMADIYRLDKRGVHTGGQVAQLLWSFTPLGEVVSAIADRTVEVAGSAIRRGVVEAERTQEFATQKWEGVFDVTYKPDFGEPITITIRQSEIKRFSLEKGARVVMFDPDFDNNITTDEGAKVIRTRPSIHAPRSGLWSTIQEIEVARDANFSDDYKKFCFAGQKGPAYRTMSGPWNPDTYKRPTMTHDELREASRMLLELKNQLAKTPQSGDVGAAELELKQLIVQEVWLNVMVYLQIHDDANQSRINVYKKQISEIQQKILALQGNSEGMSSLSISPQLAIIKESSQFRINEILEKRALVEKSAKNELLAN